MEFRIIKAGTNMEMRVYMAYRAFFLQGQINTFLDYHLPPKENIDE